MSTLCRNDTIPKRFFSKVSKSGGCWLWTGAKDRDGYGKLGTAEGMRRAHRISYELHIGALGSGQQVLHVCDTPSCVNPEHLVAGTGADNMRDRDAKGRHVKALGELNGFSKLNELAVRTIRSLPLPVNDLAEVFGVCPHTIRRVIAGTTWRHI